MPSNVQLLSTYYKLVEQAEISKNKELEKALVKKKVRSLSGVVIVSVLTKPYPCPGECIFCPAQEEMPKSYLSGEPAADRAKNLKFSPFRQVKSRIQSLQKQGHLTDKIELRVVGGSFTYYPRAYQYWFIKRCFDAANGKTSKDLAQAQKLNEKSKHRLVGISIETRPDLITEKITTDLRDLGITLVELGVQTIFNEVLEKCKRGHGIEETIKATRLLKDAGFKILYQMMPNLPGSNFSKDLRSFEEIFQNPDFKPDWLKIYPCVVCKGSELYQIWKQGEFKPYTDQELIKLLIKIKKIDPYWIRIARIFRDIPSPKIEAGSTLSNLREKVAEEMKKQKLKCNCIRCREVKEHTIEEKPILYRIDYEANKGKEIFLSFENKDRDKLFSFLRLRIPSFVFKENELLFQSLKATAIVRELHTYGKLVSISKQNRKLSPQHQGLGKQLLQEAERISAREFTPQIKKIAVISGVGARNYYRQMNYRLKDTYMIKRINQ